MQNRRPACNAQERYKNEEFLVSTHFGLKQFNTMLIHKTRLFLSFFFFGALLSFLTKEFH